MNNDQELIVLQLERIIELKSQLAALREQAIRALRYSTGETYVDCEALLDGAR